MIQKKTREVKTKKIKNALFGDFNFIQFDQMHLKIYLLFMFVYIILI